MKRIFLILMFLLTQVMPEYCLGEPSLIISTGKKISIESISKAVTNGLDASSALNTALQKQGIILLPAGTIIVSSTIVIPSDTTLIGQGREKTKILLDPTLSTGIKTILIDGDNVELNGFEVDGSRGTIGTKGTDPECVNALNRSNITVDGLYIHDGLEEGIDFDRCSNTTIKNTVIENCWGNGIHFAGSSPSTTNSLITNVTIIGCGIGRAGAAMAWPAGIHIAGANNMLENIRLDSNHIGIQISAEGAFCKISNVYEVDSVVSAFATTSVEGVMVKNFSGTGTYGNTNTAFNFDSYNGSISKIHINYTGTAGTCVQLGSFADRSSASQVFVEGANNGIRLNGDNQILTGSIAKDQNFNSFLIGGGTNNIVLGNTTISPGDASLAMQVSSGTALIANNTFDKSVYIKNSLTRLVHNKIDGTVLITDGSPYIRFNSGYITESTGTATIPSGNQYIDVVHGLAVPPSAAEISISSTNSMGNSTKYWVSDLGALTFRINVDADPGATTATFSWSAQIY